MRSTSTITYTKNPFVSPYVRRRNDHVELARRGIARSGFCQTSDGYVRWWVDQTDTYYERTIIPLCADEVQ